MSRHNLYRNIIKYVNNQFVHFNNNGFAEPCILSSAAKHSLSPSLSKFTGPQEQSVLSFLKNELLSTVPYAQRDNLAIN